MRPRRSLLLLFAFITFCWPSAPAQSFQEEYWQPIELFRISIDVTDPQIRTLLSRWTEIEGELKSTSNLFAGTYQKVGYRGYFLRWSPEKGFIYVYHSEGLSIIDYSYGRVSVTATGISFVPDREMKVVFRGEKLQMPTNWIPVTAGGRNYLVAEKEMVAFGNYFGGYGNYNDFNGPCCEFSPFFFQQDPNPAQSAATTSIVVPPAYRQFIKQPITAEIVSVGTRRVVKDYGLEGDHYGQLFMKASLTRVTISAGRQSGVRRNMLFRMIGEAPGQYLQIKSVDARDSRGVVIRDIDDNGGETFFDFDSGTKDRVSKTYPAIHAGIKVTTSPIVDH